jgi:hypothetical protein
MVYQDYDEDEVDFDNEEGMQPVSIGDVAGDKKARVSTRLLHRKCMGIPVVLLAGILLLASIVGISIVALQTKNDDGEEKPAPPPPEPEGTPAPTPSATTAPYQRWSENVTWMQKGNDVGGIDSSPGNYGITVGVSGDGHMFAEGAHAAISGDVTPGHVRVYKYDSAKNTWDLFGKELLGDKHGDEFGHSIDLNRQGSHVAVGAPGADRHTGPDHGYFSVHRWDDEANDWVQMGPDKWGETTDERCGHDIQINESGDVLIVGAPGSDKEGKDTGEIRVFEYMEKTDRWLRRAQDLHGDEAGDMFGWSVAVSDDGTICAGGAPYANDAGPDGGHIRVFRYVQTEIHHHRFHKIGHTLAGREAGDNFGYSVAMSALGDIVAGGAPNAAHMGKRQVGYVDVWHLNSETDTWEMLGQPIYGQYEFEGFGTSVSLSMDGHTLIVGAPEKDNSKGTIRVFKYDKTANEWLLVGEQVEGDGEDDYWGSEVAVNDDGSVIVSGGMNLLGLEIGNAHVRVYKSS